MSTRLIYSTETGCSSNGSKQVKAFVKEVTNKGQCVQNLMDNYKFNKNQSKKKKEKFIDNDSAAIIEVRHVIPSASCS